MALSKEELVPLRTCRHCGVVLCEDNCSPSVLNKGWRTCRKCVYYKHLERTTPEQRRAKANAANAKIRTEAIAAYGGRCACCGETTPEFLSFDHIHNDGAAHRRELGRTKGSGNMAWWLKRNGFPKGRIQLLCMNCNWAKGKYGVCPHATRKVEVA